MPPSAQPSEFSYGPGLTPPGLESATEVEGGRYRGRTPAIEPKILMAERTAGKPGGPSIVN